MDAIQEHLDQQLQRELEIKELKSEKGLMEQLIEQQTQENLSQQAELKLRNEQVVQLTEEIKKMKAKIQELVLKDRGQRNLDKAVQGFLLILQEVHKNLKGLHRHLRSVIKEQKNPLQIEHTQRQIKLIEKLQREVKTAVDRKEDYSFEEASLLMDRLYLMTSEDEGRKRKPSPLSRDFTLLSQKRQKTSAEEAKELERGGIMPFHEKQTTADEGHSSLLQSHRKEPLSCCEDSLIKAHKKRRILKQEERAFVANLKRNADPNEIRRSGRIRNAQSEVDN